MTLNTINQKKLKPEEIENNDGKINWKKFQSNPWSIFPNYNNKLDNSIHYLREIAHDYRMDLYSYQSKEKRLKNTIKENSKENITVYGEAQKNSLLTFICLIPILFIITSFSHLFVKDDFNMQFIHCILLIFNLFFAFCFSLYYSSKVAKKTQREINNKEIEKKQNELNQISQNLNFKYKQLCDKISSIVKEGEYVPIREHLDYYYHTDIAELNLVIQEILEQVYPKKEKALISHSLEPTQSHFLKIDHISKIEQYLKKIIEENIRANISQKIEY